MPKIALLGAGGKMGVRLATNLKGSRFDVDHVEVSEEGRQRLKAAVGVDCVDLDRGARSGRRRRDGRARPADRQDRPRDCRQGADRVPRSSCSTPPPLMRVRCRTVRT